jgi:hypothetical protein
MIGMVEWSKTLSYDIKDRKFIFRIIFANQEFDSLIENQKPHLNNYALAKRQYIDDE